MGKSFVNSNLLYFDVYMECQSLVTKVRRMFSLVSRITLSHTYEAVKTENMCPLQHGKLHLICWISVWQLTTITTFSVLFYKLFPCVYSEQRACCERAEVQRATNVAREKGLYVIISHFMCTMIYGNSMKGIFSSILYNSVCFYITTENKVRIL